MLSPGGAWHLNPSRGSPESTKVLSGGGAKTPLMEEGDGEETGLAGAPGTQLHPNQGLLSEPLEERGPAFLRGPAQGRSSMNIHSAAAAAAKSLQSCRGTQKIQVKPRGGAQ